ncbi:MAG: ribonuclease P protein component [Bacteroidia bacterium]|nr:ribonuclease P protein component [Bacteroidia bacterium]
MQSDNLHRIKNTFHKEERLSSKKRIDQLFEKGKSVSSYPLKLMYLKANDTQKFPVQVMFVVPKRNHKKAHDRNKIRRRMREAYRLCKSDFYTSLNLKNEKLSIAMIYTSRKEELYNPIQLSIKKLIDRLSQ